MSDSATPWTVARQAPLSMGFSRQEYWSGLPFPSPGDLPDPGIKPACVSRLLHWQAGFSPLALARKPLTGNKNSPNLHLKDTSHCPMYHRDIAVKTYYLHIIKPHCKLYLKWAIKTSADSLKTGEE